MVIFVFCNHSLYLSFGVENLPTNDFVNIRQLGNSTDTGLVCSTDQSTDGTPTGGWFNPNGAMLSSSSSEVFFVSDGSDGATDSSGNSRTVFVGLYNEKGGGLTCSYLVAFILIFLSCR